MGLLGKKTKRQRTEDSEDLDFDDEMVDSLDMPDEEDEPSGGIMSKVLKWRRKSKSDEADRDEVDQDEANQDEADQDEADQDEADQDEADQDEADQDEADQDEADQDEDPSDAEDPPALEENSPVQVVRLEGIPDVHPVGDSNSRLTPGQKQTGAGPGSTGSAGAQPAANSSPAEVSTPVDPATATDGDPTEGDPTEGDSTEGSSNTGSDNLDLSLQDIFGEQEEVDESLRDLADFVEDTLAKDLADELRAFLEELEARQR